MTIDDKDSVTAEIDTMLDLAAMMLELIKTKQPKLQMTNAEIMLSISAFTHLKAAHKNAVTILKASELTTTDA